MVSSDMASALKDAEAARESTRILLRVTNAVTEIQEAVSSHTVSFVETFISKGVQAVYADRKFSISLRVGESAKRKTLTIYVIEDKGGGEVIQSNLSDGAGGGIQAVVSFLFQVLAILNQKSYRILFLDEALSAISSEYLPGMFSLIEGLIQQYGFKFLMISQDPRFSVLASKTYYMRGGSIIKEES
jgi:ABC-type dipeptide/oligopeptide/nickel transport system ATPase subunit